MTVKKKLPKPRHAGLNQLLESKRTSSAAGLHKPRSARQKRKSIFQKLLKGGHYD